MRRHIIIVTVALSALSFAAAQTTTPATPATPTPTTTDPAAPATPTMEPSTTTTTSTTTTGFFGRDPAVQPGLSPEEYRATAEELAAQATVAYPVAYNDKPLWDDAIKNAYAAYAADGSAENERYLAELYTTTQWWYAAYTTWKDLASKGDLTDESKMMAARAALNVGYIRLQRGLNAEAVPFFQESLQYRDDPTVRALLTRAQG